jgi:hypothetical protein
MWARENARTVRLAIRRVCARSTTGRCDGRRSLRQLGSLARRLRAHPIRYRASGERRLLDETALAGIIGRLKRVCGRIYARCASLVERRFRRRPTGKAGRSRQRHDPLAVSARRRPMG